MKIRRANLPMWKREGGEREGLLESSLPNLIDSQLYARVGNLKSEKGICGVFLTNRERAPMGLNKIGLTLSGPTP
jgi:hypothetical protein